MSRWVIIFFAVFISYASGFVEVKADEQLFLRNIVEKQSQNVSVQGSATQSARQTFIASQIQQLAIGSKKDDSPKPVQPETKKGEWGSAQQIDEHTWTLKVGTDARNASAQEILTALNAYRQKRGKGTLAWDDKLASFSQSRAVHFTSIGNLDSHAGFSDYINNQDGFHKLGFMSLGENSSYGYTLEGVHLIEWVYAGDKPHDDNQLNSDWTHVGIGVDGVATNLVFGGKKL
jgi:uncharacterized protein YkwD